MSTHAEGGTSQTTNMSWKNSVIRLGLIVKLSALKPVLLLLPFQKTNIPIRLCEETVPLNT